MLRTGSVLVVAGLMLAACAGPAPRGAGESASRLIAAAMSGDRVAFEAQIDRTAVREDLRRQVSELARTEALDVEGGPSDLVLDRMIGPDALRVVEAGTGRAPAEPPGPADLAKLMKPLDGNRVCLADAQDADRCLLTFAKDKDHWRLVGMQAIDLPIEVPVSGD